MAFDPDKYLAEKYQSGPPAGFDPDKYLAEKAGPQQTDNRSWYNPMDWGGPGGYIPEYFEESPNARALLEGTLELAPVGGALAGGIIGAPGFVTGMAGAGLGAGAGKAAQSFGEHVLLGKGRSAKEQMVEPLVSAAEGSVFQGIGEAAPATIKGLLSAGGWAGKKAMSTALGPSVEAIGARFARPKDIQSAKSSRQIKDLIDQSMEGLFKAVEEGKVAKDEAKDALRSIGKSISDAESQGAYQFSIKRADISDALRDAEKALDRSFAVEKEKLTSIKSPIHLADDVQAALQDAKRQTSKLSGEAYDILGASKENVNLQEPFRGLGDIRKGLLIAGQSPVTDEGIQALSKIDALIERTGKLPVQLPAVEAKKLVQQLDNAIDYGARTGSFTKDTQQALTKLRRGVDSSLKTIPGYGEKMSQTAELAGLLDEASKSYGTPQSAVSRLNTIAGRTAGRDREILGALGSATGRDFLSPVDQYVQAQRILKDPSKLEAIERALPEFKQFRMNQLAKQEASRPEAPREFIEQFISKQGLLGKEKSAKESLERASQGLLRAEESLDPLKSLSRDGSWNAVQGLMRSPDISNPELRKKVADLGQRSGQDFLKMIDDRRLAKQFEGEFRIGSRNVNLGAAVGAGVGSILGPAGAMTLAPIGAGSGALIDKFGPKIAGRIIDGITKFTGPIGAKEIQALDVPPEAKDYLLRFVTTGGLLKASGD